MKNGVKTIALTMVVVIAAAGGFFAKSVFGKRKADKEADPAGSVAARDDRSVDELRSEISDLRRQMGQVAGATLQAGKEAAAPKPAAPATEAEIRAAEHEHSTHIAAYAAAYFNNERPDPAWAGGREQEIKESMEKFTLPGFALSKTECRTTICRTIISRGPDAVTQNLGPAIGELPPFRKMGAFFHYEDDKVILFSPREGHDFPKDPSLAQQ